MKWISRAVPFLIYAITCAATNLMVQARRAIEANPIGALIHFNPIGIVFAFAFIAFCVWGTEKLVNWGGISPRYRYIPVLVLLPNLVWDIMQIIWVVV